MGEVGAPEGTLTITPLVSAVPEVVSLALARTLARDPGGQPVTLGFIGEIHPLVAGEWDLDRTAELLQPRPAPTP